MKKLLSLMFLFSLIISNAQNSKSDKLSTDVNHENFTEKEVTQMAIFPGCEKHDVKNKEAQKSCLSNELRNLLAKKLEGFAHKMESVGWTFCRDESPICHKY